MYWESAMSSTSSHSRFLLVQNRFILLLVIPSLHFFWPSVPPCQSFLPVKNSSLILSSVSSCLITVSLSSLLEVATRVCKVCALCLSFSKLPIVPSNSSLTCPSWACNVSTCEFCASILERSSIFSVLSLTASSFTLSRSCIPSNSSLT